MAAAGKRVAEAARTSPRLRRGAEARGPHRPILREAHAGGTEDRMPFGGWAYCSADGASGGLSLGSRAWSPTGAG
jgi:hypothetical protein